MLALSVLSDHASAVLPIENQALLDVVSMVDQRMQQSSQSKGRTADSHLTGKGVSTGSNFVAPGCAALIVEYSCVSGFLQRQFLFASGVWPDSSLLANRVDTKLMYQYSREVRASAECTMYQQRDSRCVMLWVAAQNVFVQNSAQFAVSD